MRAHTSQRQLTRAHISQPRLTRALASHRWPMCADFTAADDFLNDPETRKLLGVGDRLWVSCAMDVYEDMASESHSTGVFEFGVLR